MSADGTEVFDDRSPSLTATSTVRTDSKDGSGLTFSYTTLFRTAS